MNKSVDNTCDQYTTDIWRTEQKINSWYNHNSVLDIHQLLFQ